MLKRKSHSKSRKGCQNCKRRHVKCDEQGPPCLNCVVRKTAGTCVYSQSSQTALVASGQRQDATLDARGDTSEAAAVVGSLSPGSSRPPLCAAAAAAAAAPAVTGPAELTELARPWASDRDAGRLMDIELIHRWSTVTYKSFISVPEDETYLQVQIPIEALGNDYMLNALLAITAIEKVMTDSPEEKPLEQAQVDDADSSMAGTESTAAGGGSSRGGSSNTNNNRRTYIRAAMEYYDRAISAFRMQLPHLGLENQHTMYLTSLVAALVHLLMPQLTRELLESGGGRADGGTEEVGAHAGVGLGQEPPPHSAIAHALALFELLNGSGSIVDISWAGLLKSPAGPSIAAALKNGPPNPDAVDPDTDAALKRLMVLAAATGPPVTCRADGEGKAPVAPAEPIISKADYSVLLDGSVTALSHTNPSDIVEGRAAELSGEAPARSAAEVRRDMYMNTAFFMRYLFAEAHRAGYRFSGVGFPMMGRREFAGAVARREPLALLIVAFWGVLMSHESNAAWWTGSNRRGSVGRDLVAEISEALVLLEMRGRLGDGFAGMPEWRASISWVRTQVGLNTL